MTTDNLTWLRAHMKARLGDELGVAGAAPSGAVAQDSAAGQATIHLVSEAADAFKRSLEAQAARVELRAQQLAEDAHAKRKEVEFRLEKADAARVVAEHALNYATKRLREIEHERDEARSQLDTVRAELDAMGLRLKAAEDHADELKEALSRVNDAIRTQLIGLAQATGAEEFEAA